jgi:hypothetical protein
MFIATLLLVIGGIVANVLVMSHMNGSDDD